MSALKHHVTAAMDALTYDPRARQAIPVIRHVAAGPLYRRCDCGWDEDACHREQNIDGDSSGHDSRIERIEAEWEAEHAGTP